MNSSDHLPLSVTLSCDISTQFAENPHQTRIDWAKAAKSDALINFQKEVSERLNPYIQRSRGNIEHIDREIRHVAWMIEDAAQKSLPHLQSKKAHKFSDRTLSQLCAQSKEAWRVWCEGGRPSSGPLYDAKCTMRRKVRQRIKFCAAMEERKRVQKCEKLFKTNAYPRFRIPQKHQKSQCTCLRVNGTLISDPSHLLNAWTQHFQSLAKSQVDLHPTLKELMKQLTSLLSESFQKEEMFLDTQFTFEEVEHMVNKMKLRKSSGPDNLTAEHLKFGGQSVIVWLTEVLNSVIDLEHVPTCLKLGTTIPVYKGRGKDPLDVNSYRGITINSVISKLLESLILSRLEPLFAEAGLPHPNQSAYRKKVSCADAIFSTQEVINRYLQEGSKMYMCLYDLQKAFDSIEFPVILKRLFEIGVNSKTWRILHSWYSNCQCSVRLGQHISPSFTVGRGVRQGSVLSPALFLVVMDPLLRQLQSHSMGASVNNMYAGCFLHADDIRTLAANPSTLEAQISTVEKFTEENFLKLNASKCEIIVFKKSFTTSNGESLQICNNDFPINSEVKCLGYLWKHNLSSLTMVHDRIQKARKAFFQYGSIYAFQGKLSPVSSCSIVQLCVLPILLYGVENWVMSTEAIKKLECFQAEMAKRILQLPKWYSNTAANVALGWNSLHSTCTIRKLRFLHRVMTNEESICYHTFSAMVDNVEALSLVRECRELEERYTSDFTSQILNIEEPGDGVEIVRKAQEYIIKKDQALLMAKVSDNYQHLYKIAECVGWKKLWDQALDYGPSVIKSLKNLVRVIAYPNHAPSICPLCDIAELDQISLAEH